MRILSLDGSSTCIGTALWSNEGGRWLVMEHGRLTPDKSGMETVPRIQSLGRQLHEMLVELSPDVIVIEVMYERQYTSGVKACRTTRLPVCSMATGYLLRVCEEYDGEPNGVIAVSNVEWTRGQSKDSRQAKARQLCAAYKPEDDKGQDKSDAICLGYWYVQRIKKEQVRRATKGA